MTMYTHLKLTLMLIILSLLTACLSGGTIPIKYYLVDPVTYPDGAIKTVRPLSIEILDLHVPQYLQRFHIASRQSESRLSFSEDNQWGESLRKNLLRSMSRNLSRLFATNDIGTPLNRTSSSPDYRVQITIEQFELDIDNKVKLIARWQLSSGAKSTSLGIYSAELQSEQTIEKEDYDQMISSMRYLFGELSERIADTIIAQEN